METNDSLEKQNIDKKRDYAIDLLRIVGLLLIFLAHTSLKKDLTSILYNLRAFDVVAMVFASGLAFSKTYKPINSFKDYLTYVKKRFFRLIIPCWIFITLYILFSFLIHFAIPNDNYSLKIILLSYSMINGFGYVWIVRVFFCLAIVAPLLKKISDRIPNHLINLLMILVTGVLISTLCFFSSKLTGWSSIIANSLIIQFLSYALIYYIAICYSNMKFYHRIILILMSSLMTVIFCIINGFAIDAFKNPPSYMYLSYGVACSALLYELFSFLLKKIELRDDSLIGRFISWLSKESFLIYFVHIFFVFFCDHQLLTNSIALQYIIILLSSIVISFLIWFVKKKIRDSHAQKRTQ